MNVKSPKFQIFKTASTYQYKLIYSNSENILYGEGYITKQSCLDDIYIVKIVASLDYRYDRELSLNGNYFFILKSLKGGSVGISKLYSSTTEREQGIGVVRRVAPLAPIEDLT